MRVLLAFGSFKGSLTSREAAEAAAEGLAAAGAEVVRAAVADGGEGTMEAFRAALAGEYREALVSGPLGEKRPARLLLLPEAAAAREQSPGAMDGVAVVEMAAAAGLPLVPAALRNPLYATTFGVGELLRKSLDLGARRVYVAVGGSATVDAGCGCAAACGVRFEDATGRAFAPTGGTLLYVKRIDTHALDARLRTAKLAVLCDVRNPLLGAGGAAAVFGPQKGAQPEDIGFLELGLAHVAHLMGAAGRELAAAPGAGAAGGLAWGLAAFMGAEMLAGAQTIIRLTGVDKKIEEADVVITGEGSLDSQTPAGKAPAVIAEHARRAGKRTVAICGRADAAAGASRSFDAVFALADEYGLEYSLAHPAQALSRLVREHAAEILAG